MIEAVAREPGRHPRYRLTDKGHYAAAVLNRLRPPPDRQELKARIKRRRRERAEEMPNPTVGVGRRFQPGSPTQDAILKALRMHGPLRTPEVADRMELKYRNPRSVRIALGQLEKRGLVGHLTELDGKPKASRAGALIWEAVPA